MTDANSTDIKHCVHCDAEFTSAIAKAKYCCDAHQRAHYRKTKIYGPFICQCCGAEFYRRNAQRDTFCGRPCSFIYRTRMKEAMESHRRMASLATSWCRRRSAERAAEEARLRVCRECGITYKNESGWSLICSPSCRASRAKRARKAFLLTESGLSGRRAIRSRRRAASRGPDSDRIDPIKVFERDKWRCHLCGDRTPRRLRGTTEDKAPELEHIVSLADGGSHTWGNVACSCRKCNREKGSDSIGQLGFGFAA